MEYIMEYTSTIREKAGKAVTKAYEALNDDDDGLYESGNTSDHSLTYDAERIRERLDEVPWEGGGWPMDEEMEVPVAAVNLYAKTMGSCQGHEREDRLSYPMITVPDNEDVDPDAPPQDLEPLDRKLREYNEQADIEWTWAFGSRRHDGLYMHEIVPAFAAEEKQTHPQTKDEVANDIYDLDRQPVQMEAEELPGDVTLAQLHEEVNKLGRYLISEHPGSDILTEYSDEIEE